MSDHHKPHRQRAAMERTSEQWAAIDPSAVAAGSQAQAFYCIQDAQRDIATLTTRAERAEGDLLEIGTILDRHEIACAGGTREWTLPQRVSIACLTISADGTAEAELARLREEAKSFRDEILQILYEEIQLKPHGAGAWKVLTAGMRVRDRIEALPTPGAALSSEQAAADAELLAAEARGREQAARIAECREVDGSLTWADGPEIAAMIRAAQAPGGEGG